MEPIKLIREKRHRLPRRFYVGMVTVTFTFCMRDRFPALTDPATVDAMLTRLRNTLDKHQLRNWAYVFMPDHLHCILEGKTDGSDLLGAAYLFKKATGAWLRWHRPTVKWQKDFYDHIHHKDEDLHKQISYIIANPIRKGLVEDWLEYPYLGSLDYDIREICW